jgi:hypothetical protein
MRMHACIDAQLSSKGAKERARSDGLRKVHIGATGSERASAFLL